MFLMFKKNCSVNFFFHPVVLRTAKIRRVLAVLSAGGLNKTTANILSFIQIQIIENNKVLFLFVKAFKMKTIP